MRILIVTDAWSPQINGVVVTLTNTIAELTRTGHDVGVISPQQFPNLPCPTYPEIRLAIFPGGAVAEQIRRFDPDAVHIATEGPLGFAARRACIAASRSYTTAYHTQFPEYVHARSRLPVGITYAWLRRFHGPAKAVMVGTRDIERRLAARGFRNLVRWSRGVDTAVFQPGRRLSRVATGPVFLYVGRVAVEKNIEDFLALDLPGTKSVVGDGPARASLQRRFPTAVFHGMKTGESLAWHYQNADVLVFPSRTDTFGLVLIEAMACGTPVAAFPVTGPIDVVRQGATGMLADDLRIAALAALDLDRAVVHRYAAEYSWQAATEEFVRNLHPR
jgi:glycosyltransferase involved in cell wall biosynthesis